MRLFGIVGLALLLDGGVATAQPGTDAAWGRHRAAIARQMIARLDVTSFPNSTGPRRRAGERTLAQYGFTHVELFDDGWAQAQMADGSWQVGVFVLDDGAHRKRLCFTDVATNGGTYHTTTTLDVAAQRGGLWRVVGRPGPVKGCSGR